MCFEFEKDPAKERTCVQHTNDTTINQTNLNELRLIVWNIRGIYDKISDSDVQAYLFKHDIVILTETHTDQLGGKRYNVIPGFVYKDFPRKFRHPNAPGPSGGIGIFIKTDILEGVELECYEECIVWIKLKSSFFSWDSDKLIGCIYFSPQDSTYIHSCNVRTDYYTILSEQIAKYINFSNIYLCGDLNSRTGNHFDFPVHIPGTEGDLVQAQCPFLQVENVNNVRKRSSRDNVVNDYGRNLIDLCKTTGFRIMNGRLGNVQNTSDFTCYKGNGASVVDYLLCRPHSMSSISNLTVLPKRVESDHRALQFSLRLPDKNCQSASIRTNTQQTFATKHKCYRWKYESLSLYKENLQSLECNAIYEELLISAINTSTNSDELSELFYNYLRAGIREVFPLRENSHKTNYPRNNWFSTECKQLKRQVNDYAAQNDISKSPFSEHYSNLESEYKRTKQRCKRQYQEKLRQKLENFHSDKPIAFWKLWKSFGQKTNNNSNLALEDFNSYYQSQVRPPNNDLFDNSFMQSITDFINRYDENVDIPPTENLDLSDAICNSPITLEEIRTHLRKIKNNKAAGADGIPGEFLKYVPDDICMPLLVIYNFMFERGDWPSKWAEGLISPVHKKASINDPDNYRKITVMPALGKVFESILNSRLVYRNVVLDINDPCQFGFKSDSRTTDNLFILQSIIHRQKFKRKPLYLCFVDFTKAFDYINRHALYYKLFKRGVHGKLLNIICDMFKKAKCRVKWKGTLGEVIESEFGVLQGGMLSPKLFTEFLYDLQEYLETECGLWLDDSILTYVLYADDLVLCSDTAAGLQKLIDGLYTFCTKWHLIVSMAKTNVLIFGKRNPQDTFKFNDKIIKIATEYKYLGTVISTTSLDLYKKNYESLASKARSSLFSLNSYIENSTGYLYPSLAFKMFDVQVRPILEYCSEVWFQGKEVTDHEKIHLGYLKSVLRVKPSSSTLAVMAECGRFPLYVKQRFQAIKYWKRLLNMKNNHIVKKAYNSLLELHEMGQTNWCTHVKSILYEVQHQQAWDVQYIDDRTLGVIKERIYNLYMSKCMEDINDSDKYPKLRTYKLFKTQFKLEPYLTSTKNHNFNLALFRLRISSHNLRIETGRHTKPNKTPINERVCLYCSEQDVEDEPHFLLKCPLYTEERLNLLQAVKDNIVTNLQELPDLEQFTLIMSSDVPVIIEALGKYVYTCLKKRNTLNPS